MATDLSGAELSGQEQRLLAVYADLKGLCEDETLPPVAQANARAALALFAQAVNSLGIVHEHAPEAGL